MPRNQVEHVDHETFYGVVHVHLQHECRLLGSFRWLSHLLLQQRNGMSLNMVTVSESKVEEKSELLEIVLFDVGSKYIRASGIPAGATPATSPFPDS